MFKSKHEYSICNETEPCFGCVRDYDTGRPIVDVNGNYKCAVLNFPTAKSDYEKGKCPYYKHNREDMPINPRGKR